MRPAFGEKEKERFLQAYEKSYKLGDACRVTNISRVTVWRWLKDPEFKDRMDLVKDIMIDKAEELLILDMEREDGSGRSSIMFFLKCQAKHRGYNERTDREKVDIASVTTLDEINIAQESLLRGVASTEISFETAQPLFSMLAEKRRTIDSCDLQKQLLELRHEMNNK